MKSIQMKQLIICVFALILTTSLLTAQTPIPCGETTISSLLGTTYTIQDELTSLIIHAEGGDGGGTRRDVGFCNNREEGGSGALIAAEFEIGTQADQLQVGGLIKTVVGQVGGEGSRVCSNPIEGPAGGGGGSTAVLYLPPGEDASGTNWRILMLASGGGGASRWADFTFYGGGGGKTSLDAPGNGDCGQYQDSNEDICNYPGAGFSCFSVPYNGEGCFAPGAGKTFVDNYLTNPLRVQLKADSEAANTGGADVENISGGDNGGGDGFTGGGGSYHEFGGGGGGFTGGNASGADTGNPGIGRGGTSYLTDDYNNTLISATAGVTGAGTKSNGFVRLTTPDITSISCKSTLDVSLDVNGNALLTASDLDDGSVFSCGEYISFFNGLTPFSGYAFICLDVGSSFNLNVYILDEDDNPMANCMSVVSVVDDMVPNAKCKNRTVQLDASGNASITVGNINNGSKDNCGIVSRVLDKTTFTCDDIGANTVTLTVTDNYDNTNTCTATVTVEDNILPVASCKDATLQLDASGNATLTVDDVDNGSTDNCSIQTLALSKTSFDCSNLGTNTVTLTLTDADETVSTCSATVTVEDNIPPIINCQDVTIQLNANGQAFLDPAAVNAGGGGDNCGGFLNAIVEPTFFNCSNIGANTVTFTAADAQNNVATCTSIVTVEDNTAPQVSCKDVTITLDLDGNYTLQQSDLLNSFSDNCNNAVFVGAQPAAVSCSDVGNTVSVTVSVDDGNGNTSTCMAMVTVEIVSSCPTGTRTWVGTIDSDWNNPCNWNPTCVPTINDDVIIVDAVFSPIILGNQTAFAKSVDIQVGAALGTETNANLTINGSIGNGLTNQGSIFNDGIINIDNTGINGINLLEGSAFTNIGIVNIGQNSGNISGNGIYMYNTGFNQISGTVNIDNTGANGINIVNSASYFNSGDINIGQNGGNITLDGIESKAGSFFHNGGALNIDNTGGDGIESGFFQNSAIVNIGQNDGNIGVRGLYTRGTLLNNFDGVINIGNVSQTGLFVRRPALNYGQINIGQGGKMVYGEGINLLADFDNFSGATINIDYVDDIGVATMQGTLNNSGSIYIGLNGGADNISSWGMTASGSPINNNEGGEIIIANTAGEALVNNNAFNNAYCATIHISGSLLNNESLQNDGLLIIDTDIPSEIANGNFINNGVVGDLQGSLPSTSTGLVNNEIIISPSNGDCGSVDNAFALGATVDFNILGIFTDENVTTSAGSYDLSSNVFTSNTDFVPTTLYVQIEDPINICTRIIRWTVDATDSTPPVAVCFNPTVVFNGENAIELTIDDLLDEANSMDNCGSFVAVDPLSIELSCEDIGSIIPVTVTIEDAVGIEGTCTANVRVEGLECGWTDNGGIGCADDMNTSSFDYASQSYTLTANNCAPEFPYVEDRMAFVYQELCGDGEIIARVTDVNGVGYAGVTIRNDLTSGSPMVSLGTNHVNLVRKQVRVLPSYPAYPQQVLSFNRFWVRIVRTGHLFQAYASTDGVQWIPYINQYVFMDNDCLKVGLYAYSEKSGDAVTATFDNVMISDQTGQGTLSGINTEFASSPSSAITSDLNVYPNPASDVLNIDLGEVNWDEQIDIILFNSVGQQVRQRFDVQDAIEQIEVMDLESGVYNLMVKIGDTTQTKRVVITRP